MKRIVGSLLTAFLLVFGNAGATTYYLSPSGNDAWSGKSTTQPWKTLGKINGRNFFGDTILLLGGSTFYGRVYFDSADIGTASKPVLLGTYGTGRATISSDTLSGLLVYNTQGIFVQNIVFKGSGRLTSKDAGILIYLNKDSTTRSDFRINNVEVYGYRNAGISIGSWARKSKIANIRITNCKVHDNGRNGIETYAQEANMIRNVYLAYNIVYNNPGIAENLTGHTGSGILLGSADVATIEYCTAYNNGWLHKNPTGGGPVGIWAYRSDSVTLQYNESHHNQTGTTKDGGGFDFDGGCTNSLMQYNYAHDNHGGGYVLAQYSGATLMSNITIRYNISENDGRKGNQGAINLWASASSQGMNTINIYNNTIFLKPSATATPRAFHIMGGPMSGVRVRNNIFQTTGGVELIKVVSTGGCRMEGNSYWSSGSTFKITWGSTTFSSLQAWRTATSQETLNGAACGLQADAIFADTTTGVTFNDARKLTQLKRYKLSSTSTLLNKGLDLKKLYNINVGARDYWGTSLAYKTIFHIGAYQGAAITIAAILPGARTALPELPESASSLQVLGAPEGNAYTLRFRTAKTGIVSIDLYNLQGQRISRIYSGTTDAAAERQVFLPTSGLANGLYVVVMETKDGVRTQKIVIRR